MRVDYRGTWTVWGIVKYFYAHELAFRDGQALKTPRTHGQHDRSLPQANGQSKGRPQTDSGIAPVRLQRPRTRRVGEAAHGRDQARRHLSCREGSEQASANKGLDFPIVDDICCAKQETIQVRELGICANIVCVVRLVTLHCSYGVSSQDMASPCCNRHHYHTHYLPRHFRVTLCTDLRRSSCSQQMWAPVSDQLQPTGGMMCGHSRCVAFTRHVVRRFPSLHDNSRGHLKPRTA